MRPRIPAAVATAAVAAAAAPLAGCGGTASPSLIQLRSQANAVCTRTGQRLARVDSPRSEAGGTAFLKHGIAVLGPELGRLRALHAPREAANVYGAAVAALAGELRALKGAVHALDRQQDPVIAFKTLQQRLGPLEARANDAWRALEMSACVQG